MKAATTPDLLSTDVRDLGCIVEHCTPKQIDILEPLSWRAPSIAQPYVCYWTTVIFYVWPHQTKRDGVSFQEWDRTESLLPTDVECLYDGQIYRVGGGRVIRWRRGWWMRHHARLAPSLSDILPPSP